MSESLDITDSIAPKSDQKNAEDFLTGPQTFVVEKVTKGSVEQPFNIHLVGEPGKPYRPSKSMRRILAVAWGTNAALYAGRSLTLYLDPDVKYGGKPVGGIKISHMSHIEKPITRALTTTRGSKAPHTVRPLVEQAPTVSPAPTITAEQVAACTDLDQLREWHALATPEMQSVILARAEEVKAATS